MGSLQRHMQLACASWRYDAKKKVILSKNVEFHRPRRPAWRNSNVARLRVHGQDSLSDVVGFFGVDRRSAKMQESSHPRLQP